MITLEQKIYFARQKVKQELMKNNIKFSDGFNENIDFTIDDVTYSYTPYINRVLRGSQNSGLTLKKFLKAINNKTEINYE